MSYYSTDPDDYKEGQTVFICRGCIVGRLVFFNGRFARAYRRGGQGQVGLVDLDTGKHVAYAYVRDLKYAVPRITTHNGSEPGCWCSDTSGSSSSDDASSSSSANLAEVDIFVDYIAHILEKSAREARQQALEWYNRRRSKRERVGRRTMSF